MVTDWESMLRVEVVVVVVVVVVASKKHGWMFYC